MGVSCEFHGDSDAFGSASQLGYRGEYCRFGRYTGKIERLSSRDEGVSQGSERLDGLPGVSGFPFQQDIGLKAE